MDIDAHDPFGHCETMDADVELVLEKLVSKIVIDEYQNELMAQQQEIQNLKNIVQKHKFGIDRFKHNQEHFKFHSGFDTYEKFKCFLEYLQPAANYLLYWGNTKSDI